MNRRSQMNASVFLGAVKHAGITIPWETWNGMISSSMSFSHCFILPFFTVYSRSSYNITFSFRVAVALESL